VAKVAIVSASDSYDKAVRDAVRNRFATLGGEVTLELEVEPNAQTYADGVARVNQAGVDAIVLATAPTSGALFVNEFYAASEKRIRLFLSPLLKTELFVENVGPEALEGALGVAPNIYDTKDAFPRAFAERWLGDHPLEGAYYYFDAMALLGLALEKAAQTPANGAPLSLYDAVLAVAAPPGIGVNWDELSSGLSNIAQSHATYYTGLTGPMLMDSCGQRLRGVTTTWAVRSGIITTVNP
jgi:ABC-type branched-subunit amino acid transport system substrate-binding protein